MFLVSETVTFIYELNFIFCMYIISHVYQLIYRSILKVIYIYGYTGKVSTYYLLSLVGSTEEYRNDSDKKLPKLEVR